jgi:anti-sigma regulatory factor (Ser/Thr protein kinase)
VRDYEGTAKSLRSTRNDVAVWLRGFGCDDDTVERAVLVASELASNAVQAAAGRSYRVAIVETSPPDRSRWLPTMPAAPRGRGLSIVAALSREVRVDVDDEYVRVTALMQTVSDR